MLAPGYIAEIAPTRLRGRLGSLQQLAIVTAILLALLSDAVVAALAGGVSADLLGLAAWRWMFLTAIVPALVYSVLALRIPRTPRWLAAQGDLDAAAAVLVQVEGPDEVEVDLVEIRASAGSTRRSSLRDLRGERLGLRPVVWVGILLSLFQQLVGINVIFFYSTLLCRPWGSAPATRSSSASSRPSRASS